MAHSEVNLTQLFLVSARKSRGADHWDKYDYDVRLGDAKGKVVGRIFFTPCTEGLPVVLDYYGIAKASGRPRLCREPGRGNGRIQTILGCGNSS
jgi:hypothetical protein